MTQKTITITVPNDDAIALYEFGTAMQRMAGRHGLEESATPHPVIERTTRTIGDVSHTVERIPASLIDNDKAQLAALGDSITTTPPTVVSGPEDIAVSDIIDKDGLPWDARIHAGSKDRIASGQWKARRKPATMGDAEWKEYQEQVRAELHELMSIPVAEDVAPPAPVAEDVAPPAPVTEDVAPPAPVTEDVAPPAPVAEDVAPPAPVAPAAEDVAPPAPVAPTAGPTEFVPFLQWITSNGVTAERVNEALAKHGLSSVPQLQQRPDLIPQVHASLVAGV